MVELGLKEKYQSNNLLDDAVKHLFSSDCTLEDSDLFKLLKSMENLSQELILGNEAMVFADRKNFSETLRLFLKETNNYYTEYIEDSCNALMGTIMNILCEIFSLDLTNLNCKDFSTLCNIFTNIVKNTNKNRISELVVDFNELKSTANLKINHNINLCRCILYYLDNYGFPIDRLGDIKKKLEEKIKQIPSKETFISNLKDKKNPSLIKDTVYRISMDLVRKGINFPPIQVTNTINQKDTHRRRYLYTKFERGYMADEGFLSVYKYYIDIQRNFMDSILLSYKFRDDIQIFETVHFISNSYINIIKEIFL